MTTRGELVRCVAASVTKFWDLDRFEVVEMRDHQTWWGGRRCTVVADVGWELARLGLLVRTRDGRVLDEFFVAHPIPRERLPALTMTDALAIAERIATQRRYPWNGAPMRATHEGDAWRVVANPDCLGCNAWFRIDDRTGAVLSRAFHSR